MVLRLMGSPECARVLTGPSLVGPWAGNTSFPIMLIGNTADPVTPLWK
jgi:hypothetical protein